MRNVNMSIWPKASSSVVFYLSFKGGSGSGRIEQERQHSCIVVYLYCAANKTKKFFYSTCVSHNRAQKSCSRNSTNLCNMQHTQKIIQHVWDLSIAPHLMFLGWNGREVDRKPLSHPTTPWTERRRCFCCFPISRCNIDWLWNSESSM